MVNYSLCILIQAELLIGDQDGTIYRWDMAGDKNEKYVCFFLTLVICLSIVCFRQSMQIIRVRSDQFLSIVMLR